MRRSQRSRVPLLGAALVLVAGLMGAGAAAGLAGERMLFLGSPGTDGVLALNPVTTGQVAHVSVVVQNLSDHPLIDVTLEGGVEATGDEPSAPDFPSLPPNARYLSVTPSSHACQITTSGAGFVCPFGKLERGSAAISVEIDIQAPATTAGYPPGPAPGGFTFQTWVDATFNEGSGDQPPTRLDTRYAVGDTSFGPTTKDEIGTFFAGGSGTVTLSSGLDPVEDLCEDHVAGCNGQGARVVVPNAPGGRAVSIQELELQDCSTTTITTCFGDDLLLTIDDGAEIDPSFDVTLRWLRSELTPHGLNGVIHFAAPDRLDEFTVIPLRRTCRKFPVPCVVSSRHARSYVEITIRLTRNGPTKGF